MTPSLLLMLTLSTPPMAAQEPPASPPTEEVRTMDPALQAAAWRDLRRGQTGVLVGAVSMPVALVLAVPTWVLGGVNPDHPLSVTMVGATTAAVVAGPVGAGLGLSGAAKATRRLQAAGYEVNEGQLRLARVCAWGSLGVAGASLVWEGVGTAQEGSSPGGMGLAVLGLPLLGVGWLTADGSQLQVVRELLGEQQTGQWVPVALDTGGEGVVPGLAWVRQW